MKKSLFVLPFIVLSTVFTSAGFFDLAVKGDGILKKEERNIGWFDKIVVENASIDVTVFCQKKNKKPNAIVEGDKNIVPLLTTFVSSQIPGQLKISSNKKLKPKKKLKVVLYTEDLKSVDSSGSVKMFIYDIKNNSIDFDLSGASDITAWGETKSVKLDVSGAGSVSLKRLKANKAKISASGLSFIDVNSTDELDVDISGAGKVSYYGNPKKVKKDISGFASVTKK